MNETEEIDEHRRNSRTGQFTSARVKSLDETVFDTITEESVYWIGFLMADGSVQSKNDGQNSLTLQLQERDEKQIEKFRSFIKSNHSINKYTRPSDNKTYYGISVRSNYIVSKLSEYNIIPNKTFVTKCPDLFIDSKHFWRGMIDGDGTMGTYTDKNGCDIFQVSLTGSLDIVTQFSELCRKITPTKSRKITSTNNSFKFSLRCKNARIMVNWLYENSNIYLDRKYVTFLTVKGRIIHGD